ncbi:GTP-binding nuclear protein Ran, putative [Entamoeba invadens IP1]|uniref:GTP-binding nuclear protein Ran, putative n=1 Tax=Entamoeba invadens IP1 TaxID=370355 RepID=A0A0A1UAV3_ENTIV|nr:GTP-binding nuclear protein Ran, putative [Entamoeba invadens IP1]ELP92192.1 GTP-binding nuclear protein Ran, putative [Entamoeba invadens IP1]|eukprot:XP_004258963.1 GTP-binding nuclear protein Ran, putative [Entamoeba invadens IP1]
MSSRLTFNFKIGIVGDPFTGKTTFIHKLLTNYFEEEYYPTIGAVVEPIFLETSHGKMRLELWDIANELKQGFFASCYKKMDGFILMINASQKGAEKRALKWADFIMKKTRQNTPIVVIYNSFAEPSNENKKEYILNNEFHFSLKNTVYFQEPIRLLINMITQKRVVFSMYGLMLQNQYNECYNSISV